MLTRIVGDGLGVSVAGKGAMLRDKLQASLDQYLHVGDIRGRGLFIGLEMVADWQTKAPFALTRGIAASINKHAMQAGLICYPA